MKIEIIYKHFLIGFDLLYNVKIAEMQVRSFSCCINQMCINRLLSFQIEVQYVRHGCSMPNLAKKQCVRNIYFWFCQA